MGLTLDFSSVKDKEEFVGKLNYAREKKFWAGDEEEVKITTMGTAGTSSLGALTNSRFHE